MGEVVDSDLRHFSLLNRIAARVNVPVGGLLKKSCQLKGRGSHYKRGVIL